MNVRITAVTAHALSFAVPPAYQVSLGIGRTVKRDAVLVRVDTDAGVTGWGEAHAARAPTAIAELINTTLAHLAVGLDATDTTAVWERVFRMQLASHGAGAAAVIGLSGIDLALWDIKGKLAGAPVWQLLGATTARPLRAYAGGISLGFQAPEALADEAERLVDAGYRALKLRLGDAPARDLARVHAVRTAVGADIDLLTDANTAYSLADFAAVAGGLVEAGVGWLEEPFPAPAWRDYRGARYPGLRIAAGENHYTRFDFERLAEEGVVQVWQPDLSKAGGLSEVLVIARLAQAHDIRLHPHTSLTALNMAASLHLLTALPNAGYFEADVSVFNPFRDAFGAERLACAEPGCFRAPTAPGLGIDIDPACLAHFVPIAGAGYV